MKTMIAVPCMDQVAAPFAQSLASLDKGTEPTFISMIIGSLIYESRNNFAKQAISLEADAVLWLDSDMIFQPDTLQRMIRHMEDGRDIVTGLYFRRRSPFTPVLFSRLEESGEHDDLLTYEKNALFEVAGCGFGCVMTRTSVLTDMLINYQTWFEPKLGLGEDLAFCIRARQLGYKIMCDSSIKCGHVGQVIVDETVYEAAIR